MPFFVIKKGLVLWEWKYFPTPKILDPNLRANHPDRGSRGESSCNRIHIALPTNICQFRSADSAIEKTPKALMRLAFGAF
jgi:hypothetical protein